MTWNKTKSLIVALRATVLLATAGTTVIILNTQGRAENQEKLPFTSSAASRTRHVEASGDINLGAGVHDGIFSVVIGDIHPDSATFKAIPDHLLTIEQEAVLFDGKEQKKISASIKAFKVVCKNHKLSVFGDKKLLFSAKLD